jgi:hypothetical protein
VKIFYRPGDLVVRLAELGWVATVTETAEGWIVVEATRSG